MMRMTTAVIVWMISWTSNWGPFYEIDENDVKRFVLYLP